MTKYIIFQEYKNKIKEIKDYNDAKKCINSAKILTSDPIEIKLLESLLNEKEFCKSMEFEKFSLYFDIIDIIYYRNDALHIFDDIQKNITDVAQLNVLKRMINLKHLKKINNIMESIGKNNYEVNNNNSYSCSSSKKCPHCSKLLFKNDKNSYVICGYTSKGFDWKGCGRDWCFDCGKKLCKKWSLDMLFNRLNRYHDSKCCKYYAMKTDDSYQGNFCMCASENVNRNK